MMTNIETGGPAFPLGKGCGWSEVGGLSVRDYFAAAALPSVYNEALNHGMEPDEIAHDAYVIADAMLQARKENQ